MTTSIFRVDLSKEFGGMTTRPAGTTARDAILRMLTEVDIVEVDLGGVSPTPSFADQCIGGLALQLGLSDFRRCVRIINAPEASVPLLRHVISSQFAGDRRSSALRQTRWPTPSAQQQR